MTKGIQNRAGKKSTAETEDRLTGRRAKNGHRQCFFCRCQVTHGSSQLSILEPPDQYVNPVGEGSPLCS